MKKQLGLATMDAIMWLGAIFMVGAVLIAKGDYLMDTGRLFILKSQVSDIASAANEWGQGRASMTGVSMTNLQNIVPSSIGNGTGTNAFGGNFTIAAGTNPYEYIISATGIPVRAGDRAAAGYDNASYTAGTTTVAITLGN